ncbi:MAG TPA: flagellar motor switch phosphatase FliY [Bacillota bacterium]|nr:flagellar motor switch phosphatase FliY [Bacillota bacterium]HOL10021.1 flagellar motor switch phosphatase FliY [Bacillota bacterium]HPO97771.1 flagellar motor switch phosphatase FliY [Bacillota bacterium]
MDRQILSQEEINALLKDIDNIPQLTSEQRDTLGEIGNISYGTASTALSGLLNKRVDITTPTVYLTTQKELKEQYPNQHVLIEVDYKNGLHGSNILIMKLRDAAVIADLMMGGSGESPKEELTQMELSAVGEAMNQMIGNAATSLSTLFSKRIDVEPPKVTIVDFANEEQVLHNIGTGEYLATVSFKLEIEGLVDSEVMLMIPYSFAIELVDTLLGQAKQPVQPAPPPKVQSQPAPPKPEPEYREQVPPPQAAAPANEPTFYHEPRSPVMVQPAQFTSIGNNRLNKEPGNIGLILDVPLQVTVELGSTRMKIKDILELGLGSIIELDKLAGDPVDIFVNGKLIAKGEVVVIDENFGIKVTDIVSQIERANSLQ